MPMLGNKPYIGLWVTHSKEEPKEKPYQAPKIAMKGGGIWEFRCRIAFILERTTTKPKYTDRTWKVGLRLTLKKDMADTPGEHTFDGPHIGVDGISRQPPVKILPPKCF